MKKVILIVAVVLVALVGLTSYNGKEVKNEKKNSALFAETKTGGGSVIIGGGKKQE